MAIASKEVAREVGSVLAIKMRQRAEDYHAKKVGLQPNRTTERTFQIGYLAGQSAGLREAAKIIERETA